MNNEEKFHSLIPLFDFKAILGVDDREDPLSRYCLLTATYSIEQYCRRRFVARRHCENLTFTGEHILTLREYPVREVQAVFLYTLSARRRGDLFEEENPVDPKHYYTTPDEGDDADTPFSLVLRPPFRMRPNEHAVKVKYEAGYETGAAPADLASACLELAAWNMTRYRGKRIGITGSVTRGRAGEAEHLENSMPENVRHLLEPYRRVLI